MTLLHLALYAFLLAILSAVLGFGMDIDWCRPVFFGCLILYLVLLVSSLLLENKKKDPSLMTLPVMLESWARISACGRYRYDLGRVWDREKPMLGIVGLNCSTADAKKNDPTVTREILFAIRDGFGGLLKGNLFAFRSTDPREMLAEGFDAIGPENDQAIYTIAGIAKKMVVAWGAHGSFLDQDRMVYELLVGKELFCFGLTKEGHPKHPLYLSKETQLVPWKLRCSLPEAI